MTFASFITQVLATLAALGPVLAVLLTVLQPYVKDVRLAKVLDVLSRLVAAAVADAQQGTVGPLKDPSKPGTWTPGAAVAVKARVIDAVKDQVPESVIQARVLGIQNVDALLGQMVEKQVVEQKAARVPPITTADALPVSVVAKGIEP